jgi:hypothetical protein
LRHRPSSPPGQAGFRFFDAIFVINLKSRTDRRREMEAELRSVALAPADVTWFEAVRPADAGGFESVGARGCFLSHLGCLKRAIEQNASCVLILEDDAEFAADASSCIGAIVEDLSRAEWDVFYGGGGVGETRPYNARLVRVDANVPILTSHCVALRGDAIARVAAYLEAQLGRAPGDPAGGPMHVDGSYSWARRELGLATLLASPPLCSQRSSRSNIYERGRWDSHPFVRGAADQLRVIWRQAKKLVRLVSSAFGR